MLRLERRRHRRWEERLPVPSFPPEALSPDLNQAGKLDPVLAIKPANALAICLGVDPAWSVDNQGLCAVVVYTFGNEVVMVAHAKSFPGAGSSSLSLAQEAVKFVNEVRNSSGAPWLPVHLAFDATKDRSLGERLVEFGMAIPQQGTAVRLPPLQGVLFGGAGTHQSQGQPIFVVLPGRGRFTLPMWHVPKATLYTNVRERLVLGLLKFAPGPYTPQLVRELEHLESRITSARRVSIHPADGEHDDLADSLALGVWLGSEYVQERQRLLDRRGRGRKQFTTGAAGWT